MSYLRTQLKLVVMWVFGMTLMIGNPALSAALKSDAPERYIVQRGDTLWDIASVYLDEAWQWPQIWEVNPEIDNPHLIYPGDELWLVKTEAGFKVQLMRGDQTSALSSTVVKLSPSIRISQNKNPIPAIPLDDIAQWLGRFRILGPADFDQAPYIVAGIDGKLLLKPGDLVYTSESGLLTATNYRIYQRGQTYRDPQSGDTIGTELLEVGQARRVSGDAEMPMLKILSSSEEISPGDRLLVSEERILDPTLFPKTNQLNLAGEIIGLRANATLAANNSVVTVNLGAQSGVMVGDLLRIAKRGASVADPVTGKMIDLPDRSVASLLVYQVYEQVAYGLVLVASEVLTVGDPVRSFP